MSPTYREKSLASRKREARRKGWPTERDEDGTPIVVPIRSFGWLLYAAPITCAAAGVLLALLSLIPTTPAGTALLAIGTLLLLFGAPGTVWAILRRRGAHASPWHAAVAITLSLAVVLVGSGLLHAAHVDRVASTSESRMIPISGATFPQGDTETEVGVAGQLIYDAPYDETYLDVRFTATGDRTPNMTATISLADGDSLTCAMPKGHLAYGEPLTEKFTCTSGDAAAVRSAESADLAPSPGYE
ncbi:hypothetical protein GCM10025867_46140 (plasmid) [Frondihabitans sucicola]|uniref:DUF4190 domain-containing protein n=1 Tax=Frondihabitans sucicola TaxID=1268041 RepID=A0ABM8GV80_9MICO|nr:hypothetical protein [Frondihabitans sucicola]BDZ52373.1 hypothetical protein GCM10025867_46140 [Frondihabitans sucicola]